MASIGRNGSARQGTIASHPLFPAIVALWFAALLGLGSLILPEGLFVRAFGSDAANPAVRGAIALAATLAGAALGYALARKVATGQPTGFRSEAMPRHRAEAAKRPISAIEELGPEGLDEPVEPRDDARHAPEPFAGRRRALSVTDETGPSEFLDRAPLPGAATEDENENDAAATDEEDTLELTHFEETPAPSPMSEPTEAQMPFGSAGLSRNPAAPAWLELETAQVLEVSSALPTAPRPFDAPPIQAPVSFADGADERSAPAMDVGAIEDPAPVIGRPAFGMPRLVEAEEPEPDPVPEPRPVPFAQPVDARPLSELGMVELVERFALSLQRSAATAAPAPAVPDESEPEPAPVQAWTASLPAAFDPYGDEDEAHEELDLAASFSLPLGSEPTFAGSGAAETEEPEEAAPDQFASLLAMRGRIGSEREVIRVEDADRAPADGIEPVVVFPGQEPQRAAPAFAPPPSEPVPTAEPVAERPAPFAPPRSIATPPATPATGESASTEAALREALAKLQKLSGAA